MTIRLCSVFLAREATPSLLPKKERAIPPRFKNTGHPGAVSVRNR